MLYLTNPCNDTIRAEMAVNPYIGSMDAPSQRNPIPPGVPIGIDNNCFTRNFNKKLFVRCMDRHDPADVLWVAAPDVVGDWDATLVRSRPWPERINKKGYRCAIVLQDGATSETIPWDEIQAIFIGGTTHWKLGPEATALVEEANERGLWTHMGRVNSYSRVLHAKSIGCDSVDGTQIVFSPTRGLEQIKNWVWAVNNDPDSMASRRHFGSIRPRGKKFQVRYWLDGKRRSVMMDTRADAERELDRLCELHA